MSNFAAISGYVGAFAFGVLLALLLVAPHASAVARLLALAAAATAFWFLAQAGYFHFARETSLSSHWLQLLELVRSLAWLLFLAGVLATAGDDGYRRRLRAAVSGLVVVTVLAALVVVAPYQTLVEIALDLPALSKSFFLCALVISLAGLVFTEQLFRNTAAEARWTLKHLCFGVGLIFAFDFYLYAHAVLFNRMDAVVWSSRGIVNAMAVPMIAVSAARNRDWNMNIFVSRHIVFHGVAVMAAGLYLMAMAVAGYYVQLFGGQWGRALSAAFFSAAILFLLSVFFSVQVRSRIRRFLARHFYRNKYEYGEEWLRFTQRLSQATLTPESLNRTILEGVSDIVDSPGGVLWRRLQSGNFVVGATTGMYESTDAEFDADAPLVRELEESARPFNLTDDADLESERMRALPGWLLALSDIALVVPVFHGNDLVAFLALAKPRSGEALGWEDMDLLGTVARQAASYLALVRATDELSEARQLETFSRLSAFLVHDLKNVVAQLSLIDSNARRHGSKPEFIEDAFNTVRDAVAKMNRMLESLSQTPSDAFDEVVDLCELAREAVARRRDATPGPAYEGAPSGVFVRAGRDSLLSVIEHLLQNAVEATDKGGEVRVSVSAGERRAVATIGDTGCGMDRDFINYRLFKPFDTTKGRAGMGIGAYEARHLIASMGGELRVDSEPGEGTVFTIELPAVSFPAHAGPAPIEVGRDAASG